MKATITGEVKKVRTWDTDRGPRFACTIKETGTDYPKTIEANGTGTAPGEGMVVTVTGDANVRFELWRATVASGASAPDDEEIPF